VASVLTQSKPSKEFLVAQLPRGLTHDGMAVATLNVESQGTQGAKKMAKNSCNTFGICRSPLLGFIFLGFHSRGHLNTATRYS
jgi:hypothetical protein